MGRQLGPTQPNFLSQCCGSSPAPTTPDVSADDPAGKCGACHDNTVFEVDPDTVDWRTHTHGAAGDAWSYQHSPNLHTHGTDGKVNTIMGKAYPAVDVCYHCGADRDDEVDSEYCDDCRGQIRR